MRILRLDAIASLIISAVAVVLFLSNRDPLMLFGAIFFGLGGIFLLLMPRYGQQVEVSEIYKRTAIIGGIGGAIGAAIGGYISAVKDNYIYAGLGAGGGYIMGQAIGFFLGGRVSLNPLINIESKLNVFYAVLGLLLAAASLLLFFLRGEWMGIVGTIFFGFGGIYFIMRERLNLP